MSAKTRWVLVLLGVLFSVARGPRAAAQTGDGGAATSVPVPTASTADAGASAASSSDASTASAADASAMVSSGASTEAGVSTFRSSTSGLTELRGELPPQALTPRPTPTAEQLEALRTLEAELEGFQTRGEAFRGSLNGLLRREHDNQLERLRRGFERQIAAEREAEAQARREAINVFLRFLEMYPDDAEHSPDVMFRLAELYYDEAAYAKLEADAAFDRMREQREAAGLPTEDLGSPPPVDYRCSVLLYRNIAQRFPQFRLRDSTHYLLGWVLKEMGREDEAITSYRGMVCPARFRYEPELDLVNWPANAGAGAGADGGASTGPTPVTCGRLFDILRPFSNGLMSPVARPAPPNGDTRINATLTAPRAATDQEPMEVVRDYADCTPMNGANGQASRYAGEVWYYIGEYHFDNTPYGNGDLGNSYAIAAFQAAMRASENRRPAAALMNAAAGATPAGPPPTGLTGTGGSNRSSTLVTAENSPGRAQFDPLVVYGPFWSRALYKIGWSYFRMANGYPRALESFSRLMDYYDFTGETGRNSGRTDTLKWIGVIFSENIWGTTNTNDAFECQDLVERTAQPPQDEPRPFDCAGIMRITSPLSAAQIMAASPLPEGVRGVPVPGRPQFIPQDRPWTPEAYLELANNYFQQSKFYEAITLYRLFLRVYPLHFEAPRVAERIAIAYERKRQFDLAISARGRLADYLEGTEWWNRNNSHPEAQRYAELVARNSLHDNAIQHHQRASQLRNRTEQIRQCARGINVENVCTAARNPREQQARIQEALDTLRRADTEYGLAVEAYSRFIENYPNDEESYQFRYNRADALFWARRYGEAARAYADVRESNENDQFLVASAYMAVKALEAQIRLSATQPPPQRTMDPCLAVRAGIPAVELRDQTTGQPLLDEATATSCTQLPTGPAAAGTPAGAPAVVQLNLPELVSQLMEARIAYSNRVPRTMDSLSALREVFSEDPDHPESNPPFRAKFAYLNARTLYRYGHVADAEARYRQILQVYCDDALVAGVAFTDLYNMFVTQNREDDREALARSQSERRCQGVNNDLVTATLQDARFRHALEVYQSAQRASGDEALRLYERAANEMRTSVDANRNHPQAPLALMYTALAYERTNRFDTATQMFLRVLQDYNNLNVNGSNPPRELQGDERQERVSHLEYANFRAAVNFERTFEFEQAIRYYNNVVTDPRFQSAQNHDDHVHTALQSVAVILTNLGRWQEARTAWRAFQPVAREREIADAQFRYYEMPFRAQNWQEAIRAFQEYRRLPMTSETAEFHVRAQYNIATAYRNLNNTNQYQRELRAVANVYRSSRSQPGSRAAAFAAEALFLDLDTRVTAFMRRTLTQGTGDRLATQLRALKTELDGIDDQSREIIDMQGGEYTIAALLRRGEAHEYLATQEVRVASLFQFSRDQTRRFTEVERSVTRLRSAADQLDNVGRAEQAQTLRDRAQQIEDSLQQQRDNVTQELQQRYDREAEGERKLAIQDFALSIHLARRNNIPTAFSARALEHIRLEENRPLIDDAMRALSPELVRALNFTYTPGMFNNEAPGATLTQTQLVATPGLAGE